jgi:glycerate 2-kinase
VRVLVAPQELKGSLTAAEAAAAIASGIRRGMPEAAIELLPLADGGPGTLEALVAARNGELRTAVVSGPLGDPVKARYGLIGDAAVIETAEACGLVLVPPGRLDPDAATTHGAGELIRAALDEGVRRFLLGIGGSATNDGGAGLAQALGFCLLDAAGAELPPGAAALARLDRIEPGGADPRLAGCSFDVAVDVQNPLCGPRGATAVYGPQKGVLPDRIEALDAALRRLGELLERDLGVPVLDLPGGGAAGGMGAGLAGFLGARLRPGFAIVAEAVGLEQKIAAADLVISAEGRLDEQTAFGKTIAGVSALAQQHGVPVIALAGGIAAEFAITSVAGLTAAFAITARPMTLAEAQRDVAALLTAAAEQVARTVAASRS